MKKKEFLDKVMKMSLKDLVKKRNELRKELYELKTKNALRSLSQTHKIRQVRRNIARVNFVLVSKSKAA